MTKSDVWEAVRRLVRTYQVGFSAPQLATATGLTRQSAHAWLTKFVDDGYLVTAGVGRGTLYRPAPYGPEHPSYGAPVVVSAELPDGPHLSDFVVLPAQAITSGVVNVSTGYWGSGVRSFSSPGIMAPLDEALEGDDPI